MSDEIKRKTLANCKNSEFLPAAMKSRRIVCDAYTKININEIMERFRGKYEGEDAEQNTAAVVGLINDVIGAIFEEKPVETVQLAAVAGFMSVDEAESIPPTELFAILLECALSERVLDFFISAETMARNNTAGIYPALIFLRAICGAMNTSESESQSSTTDISEKSPSGDMSESA